MMKYRIVNNSNLDMNGMKPLLSSFLPFARQKMGFSEPVCIKFVHDEQNAADPLGKTAFYDPNDYSVTLFTTGRHPKDIMRSLSHELVHHKQNCDGKFDQKPTYGEDYFQNDDYLREIEREAYEKGNMCFRNWEEQYRAQLQESFYYQKGETKMKLNEWKNKEMFQRLTEAYGYGKMEEEEEVIDESNCMGEGELGESNCMEEGMCPTCGMNPCGCPVMEEGSKPDFLDLDKDGDKEEPMKDAAKDAKGDSKEENSEKKLDEAKIRTLVREALKRAFKK
tara:strand:+ start:1075 stop:1911 length:837 start_codon:yes stop_codon:yes gene_type:complete